MLAYIRRWQVQGCFGCCVVCLTHYCKVHIISNHHRLCKLPCIYHPTCLWWNSNSTLQYSTQLLLLCRPGHQGEAPSKDPYTAGRQHHRLQQQLPQQTPVRSRGSSRGAPQRPHSGYGSQRERPSGRADHSHRSVSGGRPGNHLQQAGPPSVPRSPQHRSRSVERIGSQVQQYHQQLVKAVAHPGSRHPRGCSEHRPASFSPSPHWSRNEQPANNYDARGSQRHSTSLHERQTPIPAVDALYAQQSGYPT